MKENYNKPEMMVDEFKPVDVLTTSGGTTEPVTQRDPDQPIITPPDWD